MSGRMYSPAAHIDGPRFDATDGSFRILLDHHGVSWLVLDDPQTAFALADAAAAYGDALIHAERAARAAELGQARRPKFIPRDEKQPEPARCSDPPEVSCSDAGCPVHGLPGDSWEGPGVTVEEMIASADRRPAATSESDAGATESDSAPAHTGDGTPGPDTGSVAAGEAHAPRVVAEESEHAPGNLAPRSGPGDDVIDVGYLSLPAEVQAALGAGPPDLTMCQADPEDCPLGPEPHRFVGPEGTGPCCCRQPWEGAEHGVTHAADPYAAEFGTTAPGQIDNTTPAHRSGVNPWDKNRAWDGDQWADEPGEEWAEQLAAMPRDVPTNEPAPTEATP